MEFPENLAKPSNFRIETNVKEQLELLYWQRQLIPNPPVVELPCDGIRTGQSNYHQSHFSVPLTIALRSRLMSWCQTNGLSLENVLLTTFKILIHRYTDETDLLIYGTRNSAESFNPLLLRTQVDSTHSGREVYHAVQQTILEADTHGKASFFQLMEKIQPDRDLTIHPLALIEFGIQSQAQIVQAKYDRNLSNDLVCNDLTFTIVLGEQDWQVNLSYPSGLFLPESLTRLVRHYECLLTGFLDQPDVPIHSLPMLSAAEREEILVTWNQTGSGDFIPDRCIHDYIEEQVEKTPDAIALVFTDRNGKLYELTYQELNSKANQLAHYLRSKGIQPKGREQNPVVAVCVDRSPEMVIAFLGILKAGAVYLPLDPLYPHERRIYKLKDCQTGLLFTQESLVSSVVPDDFAREVVCLDRDWERLISSHSTTNPIKLSHGDSLAHIIYTSGSTGNPKGVLIPHKALINHCFAMRNAFALQPDDRMLQFSSMSFDIIIEELYPTLVAGATLVLRSDIIASSITEFLIFIDKHKVTLLDLPTAFWHELVNGLGQLDRTLPESVRLVVVGGEKASKSLYQQWCELVPSTVRWLNTYGPTETTVSATLYEPAVDGFTWDQTEIPIGRPLKNVKTYILDRNLNLVPVGIPGELYIGGLGVADGYLNQPEKTREKFIPNPFESESLSKNFIYSTGDVVRYRSDGSIEFVGRRDFQVKIRGFRIELGEIEQALESHPEIQQAVVIALESTSGQKSLAAYYVLRSPVKYGYLRTFLQTKLPNYMVPTYFTPLSAFPLTTNGKVDRKALPNLETAIQGEDLLLAPSDEIETKLLAIWQDLLGVVNLCVTDNFFDMGGHSLLITRMLIEIEAQWDRDMPTNILFEAPTIRQLATFLRNEDPNADRPTVVPFLTAGSQPPVFCVPGARGNLLFAHSLVQYWGDREHPIYGLQEPPSDAPKSLSMSIPSIATYYLNQLKTIQTEGPYYLVGYSVGGLIAYEMAQQLRSQGQEVALLGLLDPVPPIAAIRSRQVIQNLPTPNRLATTLQLSLLKLVSLQSEYRIRVEDMPSYRIPHYLLKEFQTWFSSGEAKEIWRRFQGSLGVSVVVPKVATASPLELPTISLEMVMKYDRAILRYRPEVYLGQVTFFSSEEWNQDAVNWRAWQRWYGGSCDRHVLSGSHMTFYRKNTAEIVRHLLP